jgi:hypothetical protein
MRGTTPCVLPRHCAQTIRLKALPHKTRRVGAQTAPTRCVRTTVHARGIKVRTVSHYSSIYSHAWSLIDSFEQVCTSEAQRRETQHADHVPQVPLRVLGCVSHVRRGPFRWPMGRSRAPPAISVLDRISPPSVTAFRTVSALPRALVPGPWTTTLESVRSVFLGTLTKRGRPNVYSVQPTTTVPPETSGTCECVLAAAS